MILYFWTDQHLNLFMTFLKPRHLFYLPDASCSWGSVDDGIVVQAWMSVAPILIETSQNIENTETQSTHQREFQLTWSLNPRFN